jgi:NAD(P)-dependent dehydrogenase (short-subunit alcohol dehydrogenase family)
VLSVDLDGVFLCTKHAALALAQGGGGSIINIASIKAFSGSPATGHYGAAKVVSLSKTAAIEMRDVGVRVNAVCRAGSKPKRYPATGPRWRRSCP